MSIYMAFNSINNNLQKGVLLQALFLASYLLYWLWGEPNFSLETLSNLYIGQATQNDVKVGARVNYFYTLLMAGVILLPVSYYLLLKLWRYLAICDNELKALLVPSITGLCLLWTDIIGIESQTAIHLAAILFGTLLIYLVLKYFFNSIAKQNINLVITYPLFLLLTIIGFTAFSLLLHPANISDGVILLIFFILPVLLFTIFHWFKGNFNLSLGRGVSFLLPVALVPFLLFLSLETFFYYKEIHGVVISSKWLFVALFLLSYLVYLPFYIWRGITLHVTKAVNFFFVPSALLCFLLFTYYTPLIDQPTSMFELANPANAQMRMFLFGEVPLLDFMSSHLLSEQWYGILYHWIFGYEGTLDFLTYRFLNKLVFYGLALWFLIRLIGNTWLAFLMVTTFPFLHYLFSEAVFPAVLAFFLIRFVLHKQKPHQYTFLFLLLALLMLWRIDTGVSGIFATVFFFPVYLYTERIAFKFGPFLKGVGLLLLFIFLFSLVMFLTGTFHQLISSLLNIYHYVAGSQAHGYASLAYKYPQQFYLYYVIFPCSALIGIFYIVHTLRHFSDTIDKNAQFSLSAALFFFFVYFGNFQRGLVRHSFVEQIDGFVISTFFLAVALMILPHLKPKGQVARYVGFFGVSFVLIVSLKYFPFTKNQSQVEKFLISPTMAEIDLYANQNAYQGRVRQNTHFANHTYKDLRAFLDANLSSKQTFLDFSNSPMLYYYCQREVPSYFCQSLQNSIDGYLQRKHLNRVGDTSHVPVVVYSHYPPSWGDHTDGVPNQMRYYWLTQFIHSHYEPYGVIDGYSLWTRKGWRPKGQWEKPDTLSGKPKTYRYNNIAGNLTTYFSGVTRKRLKRIESVAIISTKQEEGKKTYFVSIPQTIRNEQPTLAEISVAGVEPNKRISLRLMGKEGTLGTTSFSTMKKQEQYIISLSDHYAWHSKPVTTLQMTAPGEVEIENVHIYKDTGYER